MSLSLDNVKHWGFKSGIALLDQGLFSGSNFILNILLARWLTAESYGAFAVVFGVYLFFTGIHSALILEPMAVLGPANHASELQEYMQSQLKLHFLLTGGLGILIAVVGAGLQIIWDNNPLLPVGIMGLGIGLPFMMLPWIVRRLSYIGQQPIGALLSSAVYSIVLISGAFFQLRQQSVENLLTWFGLMSLAGLLSSIIAILDIWSKNNSLRKSLIWEDLLREQWGFGKWVVSAAFFNSIATQSQLFFIAGLIDLNAAGAWRALQNFNLPVLQAISAFTILGMPVLSGEFGLANIKALIRKGFLLTIAMILFSAAYEFVIIFFGAPLERLMYGGKYANYVLLIPVLGIIPILTAVSTGYSLMLRALQKPSYYFVSFGILAIFSLVTSILMTRLWGIFGAAGSAVLVAVVSLLVNIIYYRKWFSSFLSSSVIRKLHLDQ